MRRVKNVVPICMVLAMTVSMPTQALAGSPEFARTQEEWARLRDNTMEYEEIPGLIHEYNTAVQNNQIEFNEFKKDYGRTKDEVSQSYRDLAREIENNLNYPDVEDSGYAMQMSNIISQEQTVKDLDKKADDALEDSTIILLSYEQAEATLATVAKGNMITYYKKQLELQEAEKNKELLTLNYNSIVAKKNQGMATQVEVLAAQEKLQNADQLIASTRAEATGIKQKLCVMLGWSYDAAPDMSMIPFADMNRIASINPEADKSKALETNYMLRVNKRKLENAESSKSRETLEKTVRDNEQKIKVSLTREYQNIIAAKAAYDQASAEVLLETKNMETADRGFNLGTVSKAALAQQQITISLKQINLQKADMNLFQAMESYDWSVNGLASVE